MNYGGQSQNKNQENPLKKWVIILGALAGLFLCTTLYFAFFAEPTMNKAYNQVENKNVELKIALENLPQKFRQVIVLFYIEGFSVTDIKKILNIPEGTVKSRLSKGRSLLRNSLEA